MGLEYSITAFITRLYAAGPSWTVFIIFSLFLFSFITGTRLKIESNIPCGTWQDKTAATAQAVHRSRTNVSLPLGRTGGLCNAEKFYKVIIYFFRFTLYPESRRIKKIKLNVKTFRHLFSAWIWNNAGWPMALNAIFCLILPSP